MVPETSNWASKYVTGPMEEQLQSYEVQRQEKKPQWHLKKMLLGVIRDLNPTPHMSQILISCVRLSVSSSLLNTQNSQVVNSH